MEVVHLVDKLDKHSVKRYSKRKLSSIKYIVFHHFAGNITPFEAATYHVSKGWPGIGYYSVIDFDGVRYRTNDLDTRCYGVANNNTACVSIALRGDYTKTTPPDCMIDAACAEVEDLRAVLDWEVPVRVHSDFVATACPGDKLRDIIRDLYPEPAAIQKRRRSWLSWLFPDPGHV